MTKRTTLTEAIQSRLEELGKTKDQASRDAGFTSTNALSRYSTSSQKWSRPGPEQIQRLMDFLDCSLEELATMIIVEELERWPLPVPK